MSFVRSRSKSPQRNPSDLLWEKVQKEFRTFTQGVKDLDGLINKIYISNAISRLKILAMSTQEDAVAAVSKVSSVNKAAHLKPEEKQVMHQVNQSVDEQMRGLINTGSDLTTINNFLRGLNAINRLPSNQVSQFESSISGAIQKILCDEKEVAAKTHKDMRSFFTKREALIFWRMAQVLSTAYARKTLIIANKRKLDLVSEAGTLRLDILNLKSLVNSKKPLQKSLEEVLKVLSSYFDILNLKYLLNSTDLLKKCLEKILKDLSGYFDTLNLKSLVNTEEPFLKEEKLEEILNVLSSAELQEKVVILAIDKIILQIAQRDCSKPIIEPAVADEKSQTVEKDTAKPKRYDRSLTVLTGSDKNLLSVPSTKVPPLQRTATSPAEVTLPIRSRSNTSSFERQLLLSQTPTYASRSPNSSLPISLSPVSPLDGIKHRRQKSVMDGANTISSNKKRSSPPVRHVRTRSGFVLGLVAATLFGSSGQSPNTAKVPSVARNSGTSPQQPVAPAPVARRKGSTLDDDYSPHSANSVMPASRQRASTRG